VDGAGRLYAGGWFTTAGGEREPDRALGRRRVVAARLGHRRRRARAGRPRASQLFAGGWFATGGRQAVEQVRHLHMPVSLGVNPPSDAAHGLEVAVPGPMPASGDVRLRIVTPGRVAPGWRSTT